MFERGADENKIELVEGLAKYTELSLNINPLSMMLKEATTITKPRPLYEINIQPYRYEDISSEERMWLSIQESTLQGIIDTLENQTLLLFCSSTFEGFNSTFSGQRFSFADFGLVLRGDVEFIENFGQLTLRNGDLIIREDGLITTAIQDIEIDGKRAFGSDWGLVMHQYHINVFYSKLDEGFIADVPDLPGCSVLAKTPDEAMHLIMSEMERWLKMTKAAGEEVPKPQYKPAVYR
ncbi:MAG: type II toxin-antitoxin system HicB family antitoxin [Defluviitaleaceae bacterium]|nr:type II toxin-antitoxin system HicB family antitoxin [Defluviitaleaceae bacterium]